MDNKEAIEHLRELKTLRIEFPNTLQEQALDLAIKVLEERSYGDTLQKIQKDFVYDTETSEFYCYRNKYTGEEIHIIKSPKTYVLERPQGKWIGKEEYDDYPNKVVCECSECGKMICVLHNDFPNFCENCGAKMGGEAAMITNKLSHKCYTISRNKTTCDVCGAKLEGE